MEQRADHAALLLLPLLILILLLPVWAVIALLIKLTSRGPVFYAAPRIGLRELPFQMLKFRTMVVNAEELLADLEKQQRDAGNEVLTETLARLKVRL